MKKAKDSEKAKKRRMVRIVIIELIIMAVSVFVSIMPMPWRLIVPIIIGARSILLKAHASIKQPPETAVVHYCSVAPAKPELNKEQINAKEKAKQKSKTDFKKSSKKTAGNSGKK